MESIQLLSSLVVSVPVKTCWSLHPSMQLTHGPLHTSLLSSPTQLRMSRTTHNWGMPRSVALTGAWVLALPCTLSLNWGTVRACFGLWPSLRLGPWPTHEASVHSCSLRNIENCSRCRHGQALDLPCDIFRAPVQRKHVQAFCHRRWLGLSAPMRAFIHSCTLPAYSDLIPSLGGSSPLFYAAGCDYSSQICPEKRMFGRSTFAGAWTIALPCHFQMQSSALLDSEISRL